jgi:hypothetical protein
VAQFFVRIGLVFGSLKIENIHQAPNIVISGASYSASEQKTGETWIDGKPIYRRVFSGNITAAVN